MKKCKHDTIIDSKVSRREDYLTISIFCILTQPVLHCAMRCNALCSERLCPCFKRNHNNDRRVAIENEFGLFVCSKRKHRQCFPMSSLYKNTCATLLVFFAGDVSWIYDTLFGPFCYGVKKASYFNLFTSKYVT